MLTKERLPEDEKVAFFTNCLHRSDKCGAVVGDDEGAIRDRGLSLIFTPSEIVREWGNWRFHRRGWERRFFGATLDLRG
jgi:hypothetical protein